MSNSSYEEVHSTKAENIHELIMTDMSALLIALLFTALWMMMSVKFEVADKEIKVKAVTLTGKSLRVHVQHDATIRTLKREIYISGGITEPVRVVKGEQVLSDDSTLKEHGITEDSTIKILIDPEEGISVFVKCGPLIITKEISNSMTVGELKIDLVRSKQVAWRLHQFNLSKVVPPDGGVGDDVIVALNDDDVPLHYYGIHTKSSLTVVSPFVMINILNVNGEYLKKRVSKQMPMDGLKTDILRSKRIYTSFDYHDVMMFIKTGNDTYMELDARVQRSVGEVLAEGDTLYLTADTFFKHHYPLYHNGSKIGEVGVIYQQSVLNLKLGTQAQTGIPVSRTRVLHTPPPKRFPVPVKPEVVPEIPVQEQQNDVPIGKIGSNDVYINNLKDNSIVTQNSKYYIEIF